MIMRPPPAQPAAVASGWRQLVKHNCKSKRGDHPSKSNACFYLDLVRAAALICIFIVHFNATVTGCRCRRGFFARRALPLGISLGDFGSSLFFIVSGTSLALTVPPGTKPVRSFTRRGRGLCSGCSGSHGSSAFGSAFSATPGCFSGAKTVTLVLTLLGLDNFAVAAG